MPVKGVRLSDVTRFISQFDDCKTEEEGATVWLLGTLDSNVRAWIADQTFKFGGEEGGMNLSIARQNYLSVQLGLRGIINFPDGEEEGKLIEFKTHEVSIGRRKYQMVADSVMDKIPPHIIGELGQKISLVNQITPEESKNSEGE